MFAVFGYGIAYKVVLPCLAEALGYGEGSELASVVILLTGLNWTAACAPALLFRHSLGVLHPLCFPVLFTTSKEILLSPALVMAPLFGELHLFAVTKAATSTALSDVSFNDVMHARVAYQGIEFVSIIAYYVGYMVMAHTRLTLFDRRTVTSLASLKVAALIWTGLSVTALVAFLGLRGGIERHLVQLTTVRFEQFESFGHMILLIKIAGIAALALACWGVPMWSPALLLTAGYGLVASYLADGARSGPIYLVFLLISVAMLMRRRLPTARLVLAGCFTLAVLGALGLLRHDWNADRVRWEMLRPAQHAAWLEKAFSEVARRRSEEADVAVLARIAETGMLGGKTYLGAMFFFVPRTLWPEKPRTAGAYNNHFNFSRSYVVSEFPRAWGIPIRGATEAYWNFGLSGVLIVFFVIGAGLRLLAASVCAHGGRGYAAALFAIGLLYLDGTGDGLTRFAQHATGLALIAGTARLIHVILFAGRRATGVQSGVGTPA